MRGKGGGFIRMPHGKAARGFSFRTIFAVPQIAGMGAFGGALMMLPVCVCAPEKFVVLKAMHASRSLGSLGSSNIGTAILFGCNGYLGEAAGNRLRVDNNAGGHGWHVDASPESDALFGKAVFAPRRYTDTA